LNTAAGQAKIMASTGWQLYLYRGLESSKLVRAALWWNILRPWVLDMCVDRPFWVVGSVLYALQGCGFQSLSGVGEFFEPVLPP